MVRFGIIGTNWITDSFIQAASKLEDFHLTAVYSRTAKRADEFASKHGVILTFTNLEEMAKSDAIDAVYIASPNSLHAEQSILFLSNRKHVLCEKPLASNFHEAEKMIATAQKNNVLLMEAMKSTFIPSFQSIKENLPRIGRVRKFIANYCQYSSRYDKYKQGIILNAFKPEFSNGALMDLGVYCIYPVVVLFGKPNSLQANVYMLQSGVDGAGSILFSYADMDATIIYSKITNSVLPSEIQGENGSIVIDKISEPSKVEIHYNDGTIENISQKQFTETMYYEAKAFIQLINEGKTESDINTFEHSLVTAKLMEEARKQISLTYIADNN
ncbi:Gfo/Idh/MocA family protein [Bacillus kwashiorkori]|uniref:Gfo/Idh/MocA family protein n=1 Tax=Bacillus kwashiorkori TaxID=1522318 RepID=UPI000785AA1D|nr:Gfo/Idh/MocA family oxidoreductase [Bacillus kwashiorkori]